MIVATILVVDDEPPVLSLATRMLSEEGYATVPMRHGVEAWAFLQKPGRPVDLLLTDLVMPHMSGTELAARVAAKYPELPIILMSGYTDQELLQRGLAVSHGHLLTKPFDPADLLHLVAQLLPDVS